MIELQTQISKSKMVLSKHNADHDEKSHGNRVGGGGGASMTRSGLSGHLQGLMNRYQRKNNPDEIAGYGKAQTDLRRMLIRTGMTHQGLKNAVRQLRGRWRSISSTELKTSGQRQGYRRGILDFSESIS